MKVKDILNDVRDMWRMWREHRQLAATPHDPPHLILQALDQHFGPPPWQYRTDIGPALDREVWRRHISMRPYCVVSLTREASARLDSTFGKEHLHILRGLTPSWHVTILDGVIQHVSLSTDGVFSQNRLPWLSPQDLNALKEFHRRVMASEPKPPDLAEQAA